MITRLVYTAAEFGHIAQIVELLDKAKTKREHKALVTDITRFVKSMSRISDKYKAPAEFDILGISKVLGMEFPASYNYGISISYSKGEEQK